MKKILLLFCFFTVIINLFSQNNSLHFDGVNDIINGANSSLLEISNGTVELRVKPETKSTSQTFLCYRNSSGSQTRYLWNFLGNLSGLGFWNGSFYNTFNFSFNSGQWYHLAFVGDATQTKIYIDGAQVGVFVIPFGTAAGSSLNLVLGNDIPGTEFFKGELDEVRIWNKVLCSEEITNAMNCELAGNETGLITYYKFNQGSAGGNNASETTLQDSSPNGLNATLNNFSLTGTTSNWLTSTNGVSGNCSSTTCPPSHTVQIYYLITSNYSFVQAEYDEIIASMKEIQGWYQAETCGETFHLLNQNNPITINLPNNSTYYNVDYWGRIQADMSTLGHIPFNSGKINVYFIKGGGGVALGGQGCGVDCGLAMFGMDIYPEFNTGEFFTCPNASGGAAAFPCTPKGAATHEIGHCLGLPHPIDVPATASVANHSVMQTHWNYPYNYAPSSESPWGLLTEERKTVLSNPFFFDDIILSQKNEDLPIVNLPSTGTAPTANFSYSISDKTVTFTNSSTGNISNYWTFGNKEISHNSSPVYTFDNYGTYTVRLMVLSSNGMMNMKEEMIGVVSPLPLELIDFDVYEEDTKIKISWVTESEVNFSHFEVYRSFEGQGWKLIGNVSAKGELNNKYHFFDEFDNENSVQYYRLKMIDFDASFDWSPVKAIGLAGITGNIRIFPNPVYSNGTLSIENIDVANIKGIAIVNFAGKQTAFLPNQMNFDNSTKLSLNIPNLENGIYFIRIEMKNSPQYHSKLIVMK